MQRIRMSLPYFKDFGWDAEVVVVDPRYSDIVKDELLLQSVPDDIEIHKVNAFNKNWTSKIGLGSIALRSLWFYLRGVNKLLRQKQYDLIYFSTTQFPVCILGAYWKRKFGIPYIIDMQDPWHSDYYHNKPKKQRPPKYWFSYRLNKYLEPIAMRKVSGLVSVSNAYIETLKSRYPNLINVPAATITFGAFEKDMELVKNNSPAFNLLYKKNDKKKLAYIGRGGEDLRKSLTIFFEVFKRGLEQENELFEQFEMYFIGTSYAPKGLGKKTIEPVAKEFELEKYIVECTDRIPFYEGLFNLRHADGLLIFGSDDPQYTASKIYPYIMSEKPLLGLFHADSSAVKIINDCNAGKVITIDDDKGRSYNIIKAFLQQIIDNTHPSILWEKFEPYTASKMTQKQCELFNAVIQIAQS